MDFCRLIFLFLTHGPMANPGERVLGSPITQACDERDDREDRHDHQ